MQILKINSLFIIFLALAISFPSLTVFAQGGNGNGNTNAGVQAQQQQQMQAVNQNENAQIQNQNAGMASGTQNQIREQKQIKDRIDIEEHRSNVSNFVQNLIFVANREGNGIGQQVREIAQQQNQAASTTIQAMEKVQERNKIKTFLVGSDYKNLGALRSEMVQTENRLNKLNNLMENVQNEADKTELQNQIQTLQQEQEKIETFVNANEDKFSLFGWFTKLFVK